MIIQALSSTPLFKPQLLSAPIREIIRYNISQTNDKMNTSLADIKTQLSTIQASVALLAEAVANIQAQLNTIVDNPTSKLDIEFNQDHFVVVQPSIEESEESDSGYEESDSE